MATNKDFKVKNGVNAQAFNAFSTPSEFQTTGGMVMAYNGAGVGVLRAYGNGSGSAGTILFTNVAGAESMRITAAGDVGIGTPTPSVKLDVVGAGNGGLQYRTGTRTVGIGQTASEASVYWGSGTMLAFFSGSERMRIGSNGNMGIGTTSTDVGRLTVTPPVFAGAESGRASQRWTLGYNGGLNGYSAYLKSTGNFGYVLNTDWGARLSLGVNTNTANDDTTFVEHLTIVSGGNVGIGGSPTANRLEVYHATNGIGMRVRNTTTGVELATRTDATTAGLDAGNATGGMTFSINTTERMRMDSSGNLIIGGSNAAARLDVQSAVAQQATGMFGRGISDGNFQFAIRNGNAGTGAGTRLFTIGQEYGANGIHAGLEFLRGAGATDGTMVLWAGNAERARISATGAVGIGTVSPAIRLTVVNTAGADGVFVRSSAFDMNLSGGSNGLLLGANYSDGVSYVVAGGSSIATAIVFATANSAAPAERMRVNAAGITVTGTVTETSTIRIKKNVRPIEGALEKVMGLQGVVYDMIDDSAHNQHGLIAEEVQQVLPNVVYRDEDGEVAGVQYARIVAVLIEAMKEQEARIKALEAIIAQG